MARPTLWSRQLVDRYRREGYWTGDTVASTCDAQAIQRPDAQALTDLTRTMTWSQVKARTDGLAGHLVNIALERGAVVASWLPNSIEHYLLRLACEKAGLVWLPIPSRARAHELLPLLGKSAAALIVVAESGRRDHPDEVEALRTRLPALRHLLLAGGRRAGMSSLEDVLAGQSGGVRPATLEHRRLRWDERCFLLPTSGSTGIPKLCEYLVAGTIARGRAQVDLFGISDQDVILAAVQGLGPSLIPLLAAPLAGAEVVVVDHPSPEVLTRVISEHRVSIVCAVPPIYRDLNECMTASRSRLESVRIWYSTGMAMPPELAADFEQNTGGVVISGYGGIDLGCWASPEPEDPQAVRWFTVGKPRGGSEISLVADSAHAAGEGVIEARGPSSTFGYFDDPEATARAWTADGWFRTDDVGAFDELGNLIIVGRMQDVINRGGDKVFPPEVEHLLEEHPHIARAAVVAFPDWKLGERVCAFIVPRGDQELCLEQVRAYLESRQIASYKWPERLEMVRELPQTSGGKLARHVLRAELQRRVSGWSGEEAIHV